jgi:hypothetical protein
VILPWLKRELGLQEQIVARHLAPGNRRRDGLANGRLVIMAALVGGIDTAKTLLERQLNERLRRLFFPGGAIEEAGRSHAVDQELSVGHPILRFGSP